MTLPALLRRVISRPAQDASASAEPRPRRPLGRRTLVIGAAGTALLLVGSSFAVAGAHKTVTLDIDGQAVEIGTFAGSVGSLLADQGIEVGARDVVAPSAGDPLRDGDQVVVRHARQLTVLADGESQTVWTTAVSADAALDVLAARGEDVRLLVSRSSAGRADLPVQLTEGTVDVVADGMTRTVAGDRTLDEVLDALRVRVREQDRLQVHTTAEGRLTVTLQRVDAEQRTELVEIPFETSTTGTDELYTDQSRTITAGVPGQLTRTLRVVTVDGVEESREVVAESVSREPVAAVVETGTRARPVVSVDLGSDVWGALARCESGGNPAAVSSNGLYYGLYQFSLGTWQAMGGSGLPSQASVEEQTQRAQALQARSGWGQWPACARSLGLL